ncbi:DUF5753 domain-containing protein [Amycolatopsis sp. NPDC058986]|uniref:DUF5753 domain-containing protein n=1 Tax=unclassified Amycolatopsis TaxID=2618356 RepID=UPI0036727D57
MAAALGIAPATVSLMESATRTPTIEYTTRVLGFLAIQGGEYRRLLELARHAKDPNWSEPGPHEYPALLVEYERSAATILAWAPKVVPDMVQIPDYARTVLDSGILTGDEVDQGLMMRLVRRDVALTRATPAAITILLADEVLAHHVGSAGVLYEQLRYLLTLIQNHQVKVRIVPADPKGRPGLLSPFSLFRFPQRDPVVGVCQDHLYAFLTEPADVTRCENAANRLTLRALNERSSRARLTRALAELDASFTRADITVAQP